MSLRTFLHSDLYIFAHGFDYAGALYDYTLVGGRTAMVPRYASGIWWSRWYDISSDDTKKIVHDYSSRGLPLDVYILGIHSPAPTIHTIV
jgi:alpha-glucosidase (family GH31 glycosyl hydrolase)